MPIRAESTIRAETRSSLVGWEALRAVEVDPLDRESGVPVHSDPSGGFGRARGATAGEDREISDLLAALALLGTMGCLVFHIALRRLPKLPARWPEGLSLPPVFVVQPVVASEERVLASCRSWLRSANVYPGEATVLISTVDEAEEPLVRLAGEFPQLRVRVIAVSSDARCAETGVDRTRRLIAAQREIEKLTPEGDAIVLVVDQDVEAVDVRAVERLAAGATKPGRVATVTLPPLKLDPALPLWRRLQGLQGRSLNNVLATGSMLFGWLQAIFQGYCSAIWLRDLQRLGGWDGVARILADDIALGVRAAEAGIQAQLFEARPVLANEGHGGLSDYLAQQKRWAAMRRSCRLPVQATMLLGLPLKLPVVAGALAFASDPSGWTLLVLAAALGAETIALVRSLVDLMLVPLEECLTVGSHLWGTAARRVRHGRWVYAVDWRGRIVGKDWKGEA